MSHSHTGHRFFSTGALHRKELTVPPFFHNPEAPEAKCMDTNSFVVQGWGPQGEGVMFDFYREQPQEKGQVPSLPVS